MVRNLTKSYNQIFYLDREQNQKMMHGIIDSLSMSTMGLYMRRVPVIERSVKWIADAISEAMTAEDLKQMMLDNTSFLIRGVPEFMKKYPDILNGFKIVTDDCAIYMDFEEKDTTKEPVFSFIKFSPVDKGLYIRTYMITEDRIGEVGGTPFIMSRKSRTAEECIKAVQHDIRMDLAVNLNLVVTCLKEFIKQREEDSLHYPVPCHHPAEISVIRRLISQFNPDINIPINIMRLARTGGLTENEIVREGIEKIPLEYPLVQFYDTDVSDCPILDLSDREWKFISKYMNAKNCFNPNGDELPLKKILTSPRFGRTLRLIGTCDDESDFEIWSHYEFVGENRLIWIFRYDVEDKYSIFCEVGIHDIESCLPLEVVGTIRTDAIIRGVDNIVMSEHDLIDIAPEIFKDRHHIMTLIGRMVSVYTVVYDRPERTKMVKETRRVPSGKGMKNIQWKDYVIRRILPSKDAKEYVKTKTNSDGRNTEYTLESWPRVGHWRRLKSGKEIYIAETECTRRLPLSEKDIHIKL